jgi:hypothetical protein
MLNIYAIENIWNKYFWLKNMHGDYRSYSSDFDDDNDDDDDDMCACVSVCLSLCDNRNASENKVAGLKFRQYV